MLIEVSSEHSSKSASATFSADKQALSEAMWLMFFMHVPLLPALKFMQIEYRKLAKQETTTYCCIGVYLSGPTSLFTCIGIFK